MAKSVVIKGRNQSPAGRDHSPVKIRNENNIRINIGNTKGTKHKSKPRRKLSPEEINDLMEGQEEIFKRGGSSSGGGSAVVYNTIPPPPPPPPSAGVGILRDDFNQPNVANVMPNPHHRIPQFHSRAPEHNHQNPVLEDDHSIQSASSNYPVYAGSAEEHPVYGDEYIVQGLHDLHERQQEAVKGGDMRLRKLEEERQRMLEDAHRRNEEDLERAKMFSRPELSYTDAYHNESEFEEQNPLHHYVNISPLGEMERRKAELHERMERQADERERDRYNQFYDYELTPQEQQIRQSIMEKRSSHTPKTRLEYSPQKVGGGGLALDDFDTTGDESSVAVKPRRKRRTKKEMEDYRHQKALEHHHKELEKAQKVKEEAERRERDKPTKEKAIEATRRALRSGRL